MSVAIKNEPGQLQRYAQGVDFVGVLESMPEGVKPDEAAVDTYLGLAGLLGVPFEVEWDGKIIRLGAYPLICAAQFSRWCKVKALEYVNEQRQVTPQVHKIAYEDYQRSLRNRDFEPGGDAYQQMLGDAEGSCMMLSLISRHYAGTDGYGLSCAEARRLLEDDDHLVVVQIFKMIVAESTVDTKKKKCLWKTELETQEKAKAAKA